LEVGEVKDPKRQVICVSCSANDLSCDTEKSSWRWCLDSLPTLGVLEEASYREVDRTGLGGIVYGRFDGEVAFRRVRCVVVAGLHSADDGHHRTPLFW
jgi:hypothetical protein